MSQGQGSVYLVSKEKRLALKQLSELNAGRCDSRKKKEGVTRGV